MRIIIQSVILIFTASLLFVGGVKLFGGPFATSPMVLILGPGDRPSICAERARPYFERNKEALQEIAIALIDDNSVTDIWVSTREASSYWRARFIDDEAHIYEDVEVDNQLIKRYLPLVRKLEAQSYYTPILFQQGLRDGRVAAFQSATTCGPSVSDWIKRRLNIGSPDTAKPHAAALAFEYWPDGVGKLSLCEEPVRVTEYHKLCNVKLGDTWTWSSRWWPEYRTNVIVSE